MVTLPMPKHDGECSFCRCEATFSDPENCKTAEEAVLCSWLDKNQREQLEGEISARIVDAELAALPKAPAVAGIEITAEMVGAALNSYFESQKRSTGSLNDDMRAALTAAFALVTPGAGFRAGAEWAARVCDGRAEYGRQKERDGAVSSPNWMVIEATDLARTIRFELAALPEGGGGNPLGDQRRQNGAIRDALVSCRAIIADLPAAALGTSGDGDGASWPIRDEVLMDIDRALAFPSPPAAQATPPAISPPLCDDAGGGT